MYGLASTGDTSHLNIEGIRAYIQDFPEISQETNDCLKSIQRTLPGIVAQTVLSKQIILQNITRFTRNSEELRTLQDHQCRDQCGAMSRAACNVSCLAGSILSGVMIPDAIGGVVGAFGFVVGYACTGAINDCLENPRRDQGEDGIEACYGFVCGPYFAAREAIYTVPERIAQKQEEVSSLQNRIVVNFNRLVDIGQCRETENPLRIALNAKINTLQTQIDDLTKSTAFLDPDRFETTQTTKAILEGSVSKATQAQRQLEQSLRVSEIALEQLDLLIAHIQQRIPVSDSREAYLADESVEMVALPVAIVEEIDRD